MCSTHVRRIGSSAVRGGPRVPPVFGGKENSTARDFGGRTWHAYRIHTDARRFPAVIEELLGNTTLLSQRVVDSSGSLDMIGSGETSYLLHAFS